MQTLGIATSASPRAAAAATRAARRRVVALMEAHDPSHGANERDDDDVAVGWQTAYHALLLVEKMSASCPKALESESNVDDAFAAVSKTPFGKAEDARLDHPDAPWRAAQALLQHRHQWVQQAAARVVGRYLAAHGAAMAREMTSLTCATRKADDDASRETSFLARPVSLETVARASVAVLEQGAGAGAAELDEGLAEQTVKNLTFASAVLLRAAPSDADAASQDAEDASISSSDDEIDDAEDGTSLANGRETSTVGRDGDASTETRVKRPPLPWLFRRVGKVGAGGVGAARAGALKFTAALGSGLGATGFKRNPSVAAPLLLPAALCVDDAVKGVDEAHRDLAAQVLEVLRDAMPGDLFSRASAETRCAHRRQARRAAQTQSARGGHGPREGGAREDCQVAEARRRAQAARRRVPRREGLGAESAKKRARDV
jgi:U3 small nucleolar RNA-associated protein 20